MVECTLLLSVTDVCRFITPPGQGFLPRETAVHHQVTQFEGRFEGRPSACMSRQACTFSFQGCVLPGLVKYGYVWL